MPTSEVEARARVTRDRDDWPPVTCPLALGGAIWTHVCDLFSAGVATWTTPTLQGVAGPHGSLGRWAVNRSKPPFARAGRLCNVAQARCRGHQRKGRLQLS
ncbi:MAG: hypothetical protein KDB86_13115 [Actinobacteria bacterium]|nr:hypothetical protein [Actinomycetota bacterium]MCB9390680.1 hypothetical protein [Acidimicrobiia bacterium]